VRPRDQARVRRNAKLLATPGLLINTTHPQLFDDLDLTKPSNLLLYTNSPALSIVKSIQRSLQITPITLLNQHPANIMATSSASNPQHKCHVCLCEVGGKTKLCGLLINNVNTCEACLAEVIEKTANGELPYPVEINKQPVNLAAYAKFLDPRLLEKYASRDHEHTTHPHRRVYCACKRFIGTKIARSTTQMANITAVGQCSSCAGVACMICATPFDKYSPLSGAFEHGCKEKLAATENERLALENGADRGRNYQICPFCQRKGFLHEACNHITCECSGEFCYVCGKAAKERSGHWGPGSDQCPQFPWQVEERLAAEVEQMGMRQEVDEGMHERRDRFHRGLRQVFGMGMQGEGAGLVAPPHAGDRNDRDGLVVRAGGRQMMYPDNDHPYFVNDDGQRVLARHRPMANGLRDPVGEFDGLNRHELPDMGVHDAAAQAQAL
jgi:hypothetical protein